MDILGTENKLYFLGYLVAMASIPSMRFSYIADPDLSSVISCHFDGVDIEKLKSAVLADLQKRPKESKTEVLIKMIDEYFANAPENK